jgi:multidrug efflux pump subunit AcrA (membrane-fusion protein)
MKLERLILSLLLILSGLAVGLGVGLQLGLRKHTPAGAQARRPTGYHCPMHPNYRSDKPGDCPICGMKLVPDEEQPAGPTAAATEAAPGAMPMGAIHVSPQMQQLIGVKFGEVTRTGGVYSFRALGKVAMDETRVARVHPRIEGWIDQVYVDFTGKYVEKGQPLLTIYSPELLASQQEYLLAMRSREILQHGPLPNLRPDGDALIAAARKRLELWDFSDSQIAQVERTGKPLLNVTLYSPIGGYVITRNAFPKQRITPETELYTIADLSRVWIFADVFENDAPMIRLGMPVRLSLSYGGGKKLRGRVDYVQPEVDSTTRTLKVRIDADNPGLVLKPDMFADVEFELALPPRLTVPSEAVLDSGLRKTVFVDRGNGYLEPRQVETGERIGERIEILNGLREGERVVISGNFLIDSESQLKSALSGMAGHSHGGAAAEPGTPQPAPAGGGHKHD